MNYISVMCSFIRIPIFGKVGPHRHDFHREGFFIIRHVVTVDISKFIYERHPEHKHELLGVTSIDPWRERYNVNHLGITPEHEKCEGRNQGASVKCAILIKLKF